jgi:hypothetical protein
MSELYRRAMSGPMDSGSHSCLLFCARSMLGLNDRPESGRHLEEDPLVHMVSLMRQAVALRGFLPRSSLPAGMELFEIPASLEIPLDKDLLLDREEHSPNDVGHSESAEELPPEEK